MRYTFGGDQAATYPQYLDVGGDRPVTLVAEPGQSYDVEPGEGYTVPDEHGERVPLKLAMPPDERWTAEAPPKAEAPKPPAKPELKNKENG